MVQPVIKLSRGDLRKTLGGLGPGAQSHSPQRSAASYIALPRYNKYLKKWKDFLRNDES
jgi:hypothetical protein